MKKTFPCNTFPVPAGYPDYVLLCGTGRWFAACGGVAYRWTTAPLSAPV